MVVVIKVFKPVVKLMVVDPSHNRPHIMKLDEACVPPALYNTYVLWANKWLLENSCGSS
jgi:hypothetical protein